MTHLLEISGLRHGCPWFLSTIETVYQPVVGDKVIVDGVYYTVIQRSFEFKEKVSICYITVEG